MNPRRRYNNCKCLCTQHRSISIHKAIANNHKRGKRQKHNHSRDFSTPLSPKDRSSKMKINKEIQALNDTLNKMDLMDIYRTFHPQTTEYTFFSRAHGTFSKIDHILGHQSSLGKWKKIEIISSIFCDHSAMRLDINYRKKSEKNTNTWRLKNTPLNKQEITEEIKGEIKKYLETNDNENTTQNQYDAAKAVLRGKFIVIQSYLKK